MSTSLSFQLQTVTRRTPFYLLIHPLKRQQDRDEASDEDDPFANIEEDDFDSANINNDLIRDKRARYLSRIASLIEELSEKDEVNLRGTALELVSLIFRVIQHGTDFEMWTD